MTTRAEVAIERVIQTLNENSNWDAELGLRVYALDPNLLASRILLDILDAGYVLKPVVESTYLNNEP